MNDPSKENSSRREGEKEAAAWIWRLDRGLSADEQDAFFDWLAQSSKNAALLSRHRRHWKRLDQLSAWRPEHNDRPNPDLLAPPREKWVRWVRRYSPIPLAAAVALLLSLILWNHDPPIPQDNPLDTVALKPENRVLLDDGSTIKLNGHTEVTVLFSSAERRVRLDQGEAFFMVAKDVDRPFVVEVWGIEVGAVGTAFNVRLDKEAIEVLVADGLVKITTPFGSEEVREEVRGLSEPLLEAHQRAFISLSPQLSPPQIATLTKREIRRFLAWQHGVMTFNAKPLSEIVDELNRLNETQLTILDHELASTRFSGSFRSDNVAGFARLLEAGFGVKARFNVDSEILLRKKIN